MGGWPGFFILALWLTECLLKMNFEVDAWQLELKACICITKKKRTKGKKKINIQGLYYNPPSDAQASEPMVRTLTTWVVDMLKSRG